MQSLIILIGFPALISLIDFFGFLIKGKRVVNIYILRITEVAGLTILPYMYASLDKTNDCCGDSAPFSPDHQPTIWGVVILCLTAYFYSSYRKRIATPVLEIVVNSLLMMGIVLNIFIAIQSNDIFLALLGNLPIILLAILVLAKNQKIFIEQSQDLVFKPKSRFEYIAWNILNLQPFLRYPAILFFVYRSW